MNCQPCSAPAHLICDRRQQRPLEWTREQGSREMSRNTVIGNHARNCRLGTADCRTVWYLAACAALALSGAGSLRFQLWMKHHSENLSTRPMIERIEQAENALLASRTWDSVSMIAGLALASVAFAAVARSKGRSGAWAALIFLHLIGFVILVALPERIRAPTIVD